MEAVIARIQSDCAPSAHIAHLIGFLSTSERGVARQ
jgi:hypothetical protein